MAFGGRGGSGGGRGRTDNFRGGNDSYGMGGAGGFGDEGRPRESYAPKEREVEELWGSQTKTGINFSKYDSIPVKVLGENKPSPLVNFQSSGLATVVLENVKRADYTVPTPVQKHGMPIILAGRDLMASAQTGSGKTAAFLLPVIDRIISTRAPSNVGLSSQAPQAVIITPTRELAIQISEEARKFSTGTDVKTAILYGGTQTMHQASQLRRGCNILVATPGRLLDFAERGHVTFNNIQFLILDEADRMLDQGFMPDIRRAISIPSMPSKMNRQTLMFSATFPSEIQRLAGEFLNNYLHLQVGLVGGACADVMQTFHRASKYEKKDKFISILNEDGRNAKERTLVFVETKRQADFLCLNLCEEGFPATSIHGDRLQSEREQALEDFKTGRMPILVATAVAARGLDIPNVMHVVNYDMPKEVDEYIHRIGRTGRVGNTGRATSFFDERENAALARPLVKVLTDVKQPVPDWLAGQSRGGYY